MDILYEDNHILVANKPAGLLTQPSGTDLDSLEDRAKAWIKEKYQKPGNVFLHAVHRIDRPASGVVLFARTSKALSRLNESMRSKETRKVYLTIVCGIPKKPKAALEHLMVHGDHEAKLATILTPNAVLAKLRYTTITTTDGLSLLEVELDTGRYHQIRLQMSAIGCPILGDIRYGGRPWKYPDQIALHHHKLVIPHPITRELLEFVAPSPPLWPVASP